jgi:Cellulase (glycosyl hydrolase family 5)
MFMPAFLRTQPDSAILAYPSLIVRAATISARVVYFRQQLLAVSLVAAVGVGSVSPAFAETAPRVTTAGNRFVRADTGATVVLRGVNVAPGSNLTLQNRVVQLGANLVRIHVRWADLQPTAPTPGDAGWDTALFTSIQQQIAWYAAHNVSVLIDLHQYDWSSYFTPRGGGIPAWFYTQTKKGEYPPDARGEIRAFTAFYSDPAAIRLYSQLALKVVSAFDTDANVVGYEILNEPLAPATHAGTQSVLSFEARIRRVFAGADPKRAVFIMARTGGDLGLLDATFRAFGNLHHVVLDYHAYYSARPGTGMTFDGEAWTPSWAATHMQAHADYRGKAALQHAVMMIPILKADDQRIPLLIGEWGARRDDVHAATYQAQMLAIFDRYGLSWARWTLSAKDSLGILNSVSQPTPAFDQLRTALLTPSRPPPPPGPHLPWFAVSRPTLSIRNAAAHPVWLCYRPAASSGRVDITFRHSNGSPIRRIQTGPLDANRLGCTRWRGGNGKGGRVRPQTVYVRISAWYAVGRRWSVWRTIAVRP